MHLHFCGRLRPVLIRQPIAYGYNTYPNIVYVQQEADLSLLRGRSEAWTITFTFCFSLLLRLGEDRGLNQLKTLLLACWCHVFQVSMWAPRSTPMMLVVLNIFTVLGLDRTDPSKSNSFKPFNHEDDDDDDADAL